MIKRLIVIIYLLFIAISVQAHSNLNRKAQQNISTVQKLQDYKKKMVDDRIQEHHQNVMALRKQGKSMDEILKILKPVIKPDGIAAIEGTVLEEGGTPLKEYVSLALYDEYGFWYGSAGVSPFTGFYGFYNLPAGRYYLEVYAYDYYISEFYNDAVDWQHAELITVAENTITPNIDVFLDHYGGALSGQVKNMDGEPLDSCAISIIILDQGHDNNNYIIGYPDSLGKFCFTGIPQGRVFIEADYFGSQNYASEWYENAPDTSSATAVTIVENDTTENVNFVLEHGASISGKIIFVEENFEPYAYPLRLYSEDGDLTGLTFPDSNANYVFNNLKPGKYILRYDYIGPLNFVGGYYSDAFFFKDATPIYIAAQQNVTGIDVTYHPGGTITGSITDERENPIGEMLIALLSEDDEYSIIQNVISDSVYIISKVPSGKYKLTYLASDYIQKWYNNKNSREDADWIIINAPDTLKNINLIINYGLTISGKVFSPDMQPVSGYYNIMVYNTDRKLLNSRYFNGPDYTLTGLQPGTYKLSINFEGTDNYIIQWYGNKIDFASAEEIIINEGEALDSINFYLTSAGTIKGFMEDISGKIFNSDFNYFVIIYNQLSGDYVLDTYTSFNGGYKLALPLGTYKICGVSQEAEDSLAVTYIGGGIKFSDTLSSVININSGDPVINNIMMEKASGSIQGSIARGYDSLKIKSNYFQLLVYDDEGRLVKTGYFEDTAEFKINGLRPGSYYIIWEGKIEGNQTSKMWYGNIIRNETDVYPIMEIPEGTIPVSVGSGETKDINFYFVVTSFAGKDKQVNYDYSLAQNYPNPFNPVTRINYNLKEESFSTITIYNSLGQVVKILDEGIRSAGRHNIAFDGSLLSSGIYFYRLSAKGLSGRSEYNEVKKMLLLK